LGGLGETALPQDAQGGLGVAGGLAQRLLIVEETRAGLLAQLLDQVEAHACGACSASPSSSIGSSADGAPLPDDASASRPAPRWRSSYRLRPSMTASAMAAQKRRIARMASSLPGTR